MLATWVEFACVFAALVFAPTHCLAQAAPVPAEPASKPVRIVLIGDSTVASYARPPEDRPDLTGWGQVLGEYFDGVEIDNMARSGASSKSFRSLGLWDRALERPADWVLIQFGHNDQPGKGERSTTPDGDYSDNLRRYIREAREHDIRPVLVTPVARRIYREGKIDESLRPYIDAMKQVGAETETPVVDLFAASKTLFEELGDEGSADLSAAADDRSHFSRKGALAMARLVAEGLDKAAPELARLRHGR